MNCKGYTLIEILIVIFLVALTSEAISHSTRLVKKTVFIQLVNEVEQDVIFARDAATATGKQYNVYCFSNRVILRQGVQKPIHTTKMIQDVYIPNDITGKWIKFYGTMASPKTGTITLICKPLGMQANITVRIATGKTTVYYRTL